MNAATRLLTALQSIVTAGLNTVALPSLSYHGGHNDNLANAYLNWVTYTAALTLPMFTGFALLSDEIVHVVMGSKWAEVAPIVSLLAIPVFIWSIDQYNGNIFLVRAKPHWRTIQTLVHAVVNVSLLLVIARYGIVYVALGAVAKSLLMYPATLVLSFSLMKLSVFDYLKRMTPLLCATSIMGGAISILKFYLPLESPILVLCLLVPSGGLIYLAALRVVSRDVFFRIYNSIGLVLRR